MVKVQIVAIWVEDIGCTRIGRRGEVQGDAKDKRIQEHVLDVLVCVENYFVGFPYHTDHLLRRVALCTIGLLDHVNVFTDLLLVVGVDVASHKENSVVIGVENTISVHFFFERAFLFFWVNWLHRNIAHFLPFWVFGGRNLKSVNGLIVLNSFLSFDFMRIPKFAKPSEDIFIWTDISCSFNGVAIAICFDLGLKLEGLFSLFFGAYFELHPFRPALY